MLGLANTSQKYGSQNSELVFCNTNSAYTQNAVFYLAETLAKVTDPITDKREIIPSKHSGSEDDCREVTCFRLKSNREL